MRPTVTFLVLLAAAGCSAGVHPLFDAAVEPDSAVDDAQLADGGTPPDAGCVLECDDAAVVADGGVDAGIDAPAPTPVTVAFPQTPPDEIVAHGTTPDGHTSWVRGDSWTGSRSTTLDSTTHADVWLWATANGACPGSPYLVHITLNGVYIGDVGFVETTVGSLVHLDFPAVDGPTYDIAYGVDAAACGQIVVDAADPRNTITLSP